MKKKEQEYCEQCKEESTTAKVRWDLEFPLVLCDSCYSGFKGARKEDENGTERKSQNL